jgi:hypothetical protein
LAAGVKAAGPAAARELPAFSLFSRAEYYETTSGNAVFLFGEVTLNGRHEGDITAIFGSMSFGERAAVTGDFTAVGCRLSDAARAGSFGIDPLRAGGRYIYIFPETLALFVSAAKILLALLICAAFPVFTEQAARAARNEPENLFKLGVSAFFTAAVCAGVLLMSAVGWPVALLIIIVFYIAALFGEAAICVCAAELLTKAAPAPYWAVALSAAAVEALCLLPRGGLLVMIALLPAASLGAVAAALVNAFVKKRFY